MMHQSKQINIVTLVTKSIIILQLSTFKMVNKQYAQVYGRKTLKQRSRKVYLQKCMATARAVQNPIISVDEQVQGKSNKNIAIN